MKLHVFRWKVGFLLLLGFCQLMTLPAGAAGERPSRERLLMDSGWKFHRGELPVNYWRKLQKTKDSINEAAIGLHYKDSQWRTVDLPHDFVVEGAFDANAERMRGYLPAGIGWYRRVFQMPRSDQGKRIFIEFEGIFRDATIYVNGMWVSGLRSGYKTLRLDVTDFLRFGAPNVVSVRVDASQAEGWWYEGGGIYRHVWMSKTAPVHVPFGGTFVSSSFKDNVPQGPATVQVRTSVSNRGTAPCQAAVVSTIVDPAGKVVSQAEKSVAVTPLAEAGAEQALTVAAPELWSLETPRLYTLRTVVKVNGAEVDREETPFGIRTIQYDANKGFLLNGKVVKITGASCHQDHAGVGVALPDGVIEYRIRRLKEMGIKGYRTAHHPASPALLAACDRLGMLVFEETRTMSSSPEALDDLKTMILRDRNHPSIVLWGLGNEERFLEKNPYGRQMITTMLGLVHTLDLTRPVTAASFFPTGNSFINLLDVTGINYHREEWDAYHQQHPEKAMIETEMATNGSTRGQYEADFSKGYLSDYGEHYAGTDNREGELKALLDRPWMGGGFIWTGFDYRGEPSPFHSKSLKQLNLTLLPFLGNDHQGIMDLCGFPKNRFYYYQAAFVDRPVLHLFPHWNWPGREGQPIKVRCYSNLDEVELFLNGKSQGRQKMPRLSHLEWNVTYAPGTLEAVGYRAGKVAARDKVETTGAPVRVKLEANRPALRGDAEDVALITVKALDAQGREVPTAASKIQFKLDGPARFLGVGNGDPASTEPNKRPERSLFGGLAQVIVQAMAEPGTATLTASSPGLESAELKIDIQPAARRPYLPSPVSTGKEEMYYEGDYSPVNPIPAAGIPPRAGDGY